MESTETQKPPWPLPTDEQLAPSIKKLRYLDDVFFKTCLKGDRELMGLMFRVILDEPGLVITRAETAETMPNLLNREVTLDALGTDQSGRKLNLEVQNKKEGADINRALYHAGLICAAAARKSAAWRDIPRVGVVFAVVADMSGEFGGDAPLWHLDLCIRETGKVMDTWLQVVYANAGQGHRDASTPLGRLMHDFAEADPDKMFYKELAEKARFFKADQKGRHEMCDVLREEFRDQFAELTAVVRAEGEAVGDSKARKEIVINLLAAGDTEEKVANCVKIPLSEVKLMKEEYERGGARLTR